MRKRPSAVLFRLSKRDLSREGRNSVSLFGTACLASAFPFPEMACFLQGFFWENDGTVRAPKWSYVSVPNSYLVFRVLPPPITLDHVNKTKKSHCSGCVMSCVCQTKIIEKAIA